MKPTTKIKSRKTNTRASLAKPSPVKRSSRKIAVAKTARAKSSREKVEAHRQRMRKRGMKLIQIWVPDPASPYFVAEARRQSRLLARSPTEKDDQAFVDAVTDWNWE